MPQGAARRRLERAAGGELSEWDLLQRGAFNPVGNLRVVPDAATERRPHRPFTLAEMTARGDEFLEFAADVIGAAVTGATDTQGEAPKFWIVQDAEGHWYPDDGHCDAFATKHALLKFPVPEAGINSQLMLRNEAAFQRVARRVGLRTTVELPFYTDGALLVPRFDRHTRAGLVERLGVESLYSLCGITDSAQPLRHDQVLIELAQVLTDFDTELREYVWRDLFNLAVGNRDNHGRNTAVLKGIDGTVRLAPIFDVGPTFLDVRAIARVIRWDGETAGGSDWHRVLDHLELRAREARVQIDIDRVARYMGDFGERLQVLPEIMRDSEVDQVVIDARTGDIERLVRGLANLPRSGANHASSPP